MKSKPVSIKDIADHLNISISTVSFVLNGKAEEKHISKKMTQKVLDYTKLIGYKPNQIAQSLRTGRSKILVFMVEDISSSFFSKLARIFEDMIYKKGYKVIFCSNENNDQKSRELIDLFNFRQVDGFIIVPSPGIKDTVEDLINYNIPVVLMDRFFEDLQCNYVGIDNVRASNDAVLHLIKNSFKNIGFITTTSNQSQMRDRLNGYDQAIFECGLKPNILKIPENKLVEAKEYIRDFFVKNINLDSVFFSTNYLAQSGLEVFKENDYVLLKKLGIISFEDHDMFRLCPTSISCVSQPLSEISAKLMETMLSLLENRDEVKSFHKSILKTELIIRDSSLSK